MSSSRAGRQRDAIWDDFEGLPATSKQKATRAKCKSCGQEVQGLVQRLRNHKKKCQGETTSSCHDPIEEIIMLENTSSPCRGKQYSDSMCLRLRCF